MELKSVRSAAYRLPFFNWITSVSASMWFPPLGMIDGLAPGLSAVVADAYGAVCRAVRCVRPRFIIEPHDEPAIGQLPDRGTGVVSADWDRDSAPRTRSCRRRSR